MKIIKAWSIILGVSVLSWGADIQDVQASDPAYLAIQSSVNKGYFTLVKDGEFLPNQPVTRKELAVLLQRIDTINKTASLSTTDLIALQSFSEQFKRYLESQENETGAVSSQVGQIRTEQKTINYDLSRLQDQLSQTEKKQNEQTPYIWAGIGLGVLGILMK